MKLVIFDFDGVLANTEEFAYQIHKEVNKDLTWKRFQEFSNANFHDILGKAVENGEHIIPKDFYERYEKELNVLTMHESLHNLIISLAQKYKLIIVSSSDSSYLRNYINKEKLLECFSDILGSDVHLSKVFKIKNILEKYNSSPKEAIFVTDTTGDIKEARACGVASIAVSWGLHDREELLKENPYALVDIPEQLEEKIEEFFK